MFRIETPLPRHTGRWVLLAICLSALWWSYGLLDGGYDPGGEALIAALLATIQVGLLFLVLLVIRLLLFAVTKARKRPVSDASIGMPPAN